MTKIIDRAIVRETEKAIQVECLTLRGTKRVWFPRSQIKIVGRTIELSDWIAGEKQREFGYFMAVPAQELASLQAAE